MTRRGTGEPFNRQVVPSEDPAELYEHAPCGYLSTLPDGTVIKINQTLLDWLGYERGEVVGVMRMTDLLTGGSRIYHETHFRPALSADGSVWEVAADLRCADERRLPVLLNSILSRDEGGTPRVIRTSVFDARMRREYEQELLRARQRAEESEARVRELATTLQASLIPPILAQVKGLEVGAAYHPAGDGSEVGGDFYDLFEASDGDWVAALGDVSGKGAEAAVMTGLVRYGIRASSIGASLPNEVLTAVNTILLQDPTERFCTAICLRLHRLRDGRWRVTFSLAGHPQPLLVRSDGVRLIGRSGGLLGIFPHTELHDTTVVLEPGQGLLAYTDGLTEARQGDTFLEEEGLIERVHARRHLPADKMAASLADEIVAFQDGHPRDDIALLYLRAPDARTPTGPPSR